MISDHKLLWLKFARKPFTAASMTITARRLLGAWESTWMEWEPGDVSRYLRLNKRYSKSLIRAVERSTHKVVINAFQWGLPLEAAVYLSPEWKIKCKYCRGLLASVPCNACLMHRKRHDTSIVTMTERFPLYPREPSPTLHRPGSRAKFELMCRRAARGETVYSDLDAKADLR